MEVRFVPAIHAALAYLVEFLVERSLLIFDGAAGLINCGVDRIVKFAQILCRHVFRYETREANTVVNHRNVDPGCRIELAMKVIGQCLYPIFRPQRDWPEIVDNDRVLAVVEANGRLCAAEAWSPRPRLVLPFVLFVTHH